MFNRSTEPATFDLDHARFMALINNMSDGFLAVNNNGQITLSNSVALNILDTNTLNNRLLSGLNLVDSKNENVDLFKLAQSHSGKFASRDIAYRYKDGSKINLYLSISVVKSAYGGHAKDEYVVLFRDITQEKALEETREEFISVASHELRTPVAIAEGSLSNARLLAEKTNAGDTLKQTIVTAHDQVVFLASLINDLAMLSRADRGHTAMSVEEFNVAELLDSIQQDYQHQAKEKGLELVVTKDKGAPSVQSCRLYVREILQNFVTNALKYTENGQVTIQATKRDGGVEFSVKDTGIGISQSDQNKLFSKFFRSEEDWRVKKVSGTGLGLYVSAKLAQLLGGNIKMSSELNKGSQFSVFVPNIVKPVNSK